MTIRLCCAKDCDTEISDKDRSGRCIVAVHDETEQSLCRIVVVEVCRAHVMELTERDAVRDNEGWFYLVVRVLRRDPWVDAVWSRPQPNRHEYIWDPNNAERGAQNDDRRDTAETAPPSADSGASCIPDSAKPI